MRPGRIHAAPPLRTTPRQRGLLGRAWSKPSRHHPPTRRRTSRGSNCNATATRPDRGVGSSSCLRPTTTTLKRPDRHAAHVWPPAPPRTRASWRPMPTPTQRHPAGHTCRPSGGTHGSRRRWSRSWPSTGGTAPAGQRARVPEPARGLTAARAGSPMSTHRTLVATSGSRACTGWCLSSSRASRTSFRRARSTSKRASPSP
mmetsp:Transcript_26831/g.86072  ORF Transcript_26831/g.86072 Transcript_26831/m.86072 type:complete len:201 (-) Transcript_26831:157-759(-)